MGIDLSQLLSWTSQFSTVTAASQSFVIAMDARNGNKGLLNDTPITYLYVRISVITNLSTSSSDRKYVKLTRDTTTAQAQYSFP